MSNEFINLTFSSEGKIKDALLSVPLINKGRLKLNEASDKLMRSINYAKDSIRKLSVNEKKILMYVNKSFNRTFYQKYIGRLESGAWERYADEAYVLENVMVGDPVKILNDVAPVYMKSLADSIISSYDKLYNIAVAISDRSVSMDEIHKMIKKYSKGYVDIDLKTTEKSKDSSYDFILVRATASRIADALLQHGKRKIYGYDRKTMVLKKLPPANHTIATLFVRNPYEKPVEQRVTDIFDGYESFNILASFDKTKFFDIFEQVNFHALSSINSDKINNFINVKHNLKRSFNDGEKQDKDENFENDKKERYKCMVSVSKSLRTLISMKSYIVECTTMYYQMILRVDTLARKCLESILIVEKHYADDKYGDKLSHINNNEWKSNPAKKQFNDTMKEAEKNAWENERGEDQFGKKKYTEPTIKNSAKSFVGWAVNTLLHDI